MLSSWDILADLVSMPTVSRSSNAELIAYATRILVEGGFEVVQVDAAAGRSNLFASLGPRDRNGVILSGHTDVVPVDGQAWESDPYRLVERDGRLYGRGAADMKGFIACVLHAARTARRHDLKLPLHVALSCDEEIGCVGVRPLLSYLRATGVGAAFCVVGEPTSMRVATSHKGKIAARAICVGAEAHSAMAQQGVNAIHLAADLIAAFRDLQLELASLVSVALPETGKEAPYSTVHVGLISGGVALNIVPARCEIDFEIRNMPEVSAAAILAQARRMAAAIVARCEDPRAEIHIEEVGGYPGLHTPDERIGDAISLLCGNDRINLSFGTEAGLFSEVLGVPVVICGPGSMDQGHKANEYVALEELQRCDAMLQRILRRLSMDRPL